MSASEELITLLAGGSPLTGAGDRVAFDEAEQEWVFPFIVIRRVRIYREYGLDNTLLATHQTFHIECWAETRLAAQEIEEEVVGRLASIGIPPEENDPDAIEPNQDVRCCVVVVKFID